MSSRCNGTVSITNPVAAAIPRQHLYDEAAALDESLHGPTLIDLFLEGGRRRPLGGVTAYRRHGCATLAWALGDAGKT